MPWQMLWRSPCFGLDDCCNRAKGFSIFFYFLFVLRSPKTKSKKQFFTPTTGTWSDGSNFRAILEPGPTYPDWFCTLQENVWHVGEEPLKILRVFLSKFRISVHWIVRGLLFLARPKSGGPEIGGPISYVQVDSDRKQIKIVERGLFTHFKKNLC